jgi:sRNA-binding carbon storage regulator CsrA
MLVLGRKSAKSLEKKKLDQRFSSIRITVPASTTDRIIEVMLIEIRPGKDTSRIGITADRDVAVSRMELVD